MEKIVCMWKFFISVWERMLAMSYWGQSYCYCFDKLVKKEEEPFSIIDWRGDTISSYGELDKLLVIESVKTLKELNLIFHLFTIF